MKDTLTVDLLLRAYCQGIFPMGSDDGVIRWYSPDPRCIFDLDDFHVPSRMARTYRKNLYEMRVDTCFREVMIACSDRQETWITEPILEVYCQLHQYGFAHSVESFYDGQLVGGLYGVTVGGAFMGESMFARRTDASKYALIYLVERLKERGYILLDTQYNNNHLATFNAVEIPRIEYLARLNDALMLNCKFD